MIPIIMNKQANSQLRAELQEINLNNLLKTGAFQFANESTPWFPYTSGQIGPYYVQTITVEKNGRTYATAIESFARFVESEIPGFDAISGGETRDWDFSNPLAVALRKPHVKLYKEREPLGAAMKGKSILHVSDLNNEGSSVRDFWMPAIEKHGGRMIGLVSFVDRMEDGFFMLRELGLPVMSIVPLDERAWNIALDGGYVSAETHRSLVERMKNRRDWAVRTLLQYPDRFKSLFDNPLTRSKAQKIMSTYPEIQANLKRMIKDFE